jgi:tRNA/rRNA methyltransferase
VKQPTNSNQAGHGDASGAPKPKKSILSQGERAALPLEEVGPAVCLVRPQMGENIGGASRAMANFGLDRLKIVAPRDGWPNEKAVAMAAGADWPLTGAQVTATLDEALSQATLVLATSGAPRNAERPVMGPEDAARICRDHIAAGGSPVVMFGAERTGLEQEELVRADIIVTYPTSPRFASLNLAASVAVFGYAWVASRSMPGLPDGWYQPGRTPGPRAGFEALLTNLVAELDDARFFWPADRRATMLEVLRTGLQRASFTVNELNLLQGAIKALVTGPRRRSVQEQAARTRQVAGQWLAAVSAGDTGAAQSIESPHVSLEAVRAQLSGQTVGACLTSDDNHALYELAGGRASVLVRINGNRVHGAIVLAPI